MGLKLNTNRLPRLSRFEKHALIAGLLLLAIIGCGATFPFKHYGLDAQNYDGTLLGPDPKQDLPLSECKPDERVRGKCVVMLSSEFFRMKFNYLDISNRLIACERRLAVEK